MDACMVIQCEMCQEIMMLNLSYSNIMMVSFIRRLRSLLKLEHGTKACALFIIHPLLQ